MKSKDALTVILLLFVAGSVAALAIRRFGSAPPSVDQGVIAYYFHGNYRCPKCRKIEAYAEEAVQSCFADQLNDGRLHWYVVNYDNPANRHFKKEYQFVAPTVILARIEGGRQTQWRDLSEVWNLLEDKEAFVDFVQKQVEAFLEGKQ